jgi:hypothetical protein
MIAKSFRTDRNAKGKMMSTNQYYIEGYPSLADFIASDEDRSTYIFKRFDRLAVRNLLHLQSKLAALQARQDELDMVSDADPGFLRTKDYLRNFDALTAAASTGDLRQQERLELAERIQNTMKDYRQ